MSLVKYESVSKPSLPVVFLLLSRLSMSAVVMEVHRVDFFQISDFRTTLNYLPTIFFLHLPLQFNHKKTFENVLDFLEGWIHDAS